MHAVPVWWCTAAARSAVRRGMHMCARMHALQDELDILPLIVDNLEPDMALWTKEAPFATKQILEAAQARARRHAQPHGMGLSRKARRRGLLQLQHSPHGKACS